VLGDLLILTELHCFTYSAVKRLLDPRCLRFRESFNFPFTSLGVKNLLAPPTFAIPKGLISVLRPPVIFLGVPPRAN